jgi:hypothetical protein
MNGMQLSQDSQTAERGSEPLVFGAGDGRLKTQSGQIVDGEILSHGRAGCLMYGPYEPLAVGSYEVVLYGTMGAYGVEGAFLEAVSLGGTRFLERTYLQREDEQGCLCRFSIVVDEGCPDFEARLIVTEGCSLAIASLEIRACAAPPADANGTAVANAEYPVWVVLTGIVRDEQSLLGRLRFFAELKRSGLVAQLVFSTWKGELNEFPSIVQILQENDFVLVESDPPDFVCRGHYLHQAVTISNALNVCPAHSFVLKTRTDKAGETSGFFEERTVSFLKGKAYARPCGRGAGALKYRIGVFDAYFVQKSLHAPVLFFWNDINYFGYRGDLKRLLNFNAIDFEYKKLVPEQVLFSTRFSTLWASIGEFYRAANQWQLIVSFLFDPTQHLDKLDDLTQFLCSKRLFRTAFIAERYALACCFFDILTGRNVTFHARYRGFDLMPASTSESSLDVAERLIEAGNDVDFDADIEEIEQYLRRELGINPVWPGSSRGNRAYEFDTPNISAPASHLASGKMAS